MEKKSIVRRGDAKVRLVWSTPLYVCANAIRMSHDNRHLSDSFPLREEEYQGDAFEHISCGMCGSKILRVNIFDTVTCQDCGHFVSLDQHTGSKDRNLVYRIGNKMKHKSVLEQLVYWFDIEGISRACLQELARHRMARLTVKSTRYTLKELKNEEKFFDFEKGVADLERARKYAVLTGDAAVDDIIVKNLELFRQAVDTNKPNDVVKFALPESFKTKLQWQIDMRNLQNFLELRLAKDALWEIRDLARSIANGLPEDHKYLVAETVKEKFPEMFDEDKWERFLPESGNLG